MSAPLQITNTSPCSVVAMDGPCCDTGDADSQCSSSPALWPGHATSCEGAVWTHIRDNRLIFWLLGVLLAFLGATNIVISWTSLIGGAPTTTTWCLGLLELILLAYCGSMILFTPCMIMFNIGSKTPSTAATEIVVEHHYLLRSIVSPKFFSAELKLGRETITFEDGPFFNNTGSAIWLSVTRNEVGNIEKEQQEVLLRCVVDYSVYSMFLPSSASLLQSKSDHQQPCNGVNVQKWCNFVRSFASSTTANNNNNNMHSSKLSSVHSSSSEHCFVNDVV